jgi:hypothetical protein
MRILAAIVALLLLAAPAAGREPASKAQWDTAYANRRQWADATLSDQPKSERVYRAICNADADLLSQGYDAKLWRFAMLSIYNARYHKSQASISEQLSYLSSTQRLQFCEAVERCCYDLLPSSMDRRIRATAYANAIMADLLEPR